METLPGSDIRNSLGISATVAAEGVDAGLKRADRLSADSAQKSRALGVAGAQLIALRMYPQAAAILSAGIQGQENAAAVARQIEILRTLQPYTPPASAEATPTAVVQRMVADSALNKLTRNEIADDCEPQWLRQPGGVGSRHGKDRRVDTLVPGSDAEDGLYRGEPCRHHTGHDEDFRKRGRRDWLPGYDANDLAPRHVSFL